MFNLAPDQVFAVLVAIAVGTGAGAWLYWLGSKCRAEYSAVEAANQLRARNKAIQSDVRIRMVGGQL